MPKVLMIGPSLDAMGGISTVENNIMKWSNRNEGSIEFISTTAEGGKFKKLSIALVAYMKYLSRLNACDLVHVHMASRGSYRRKKIFMRAAFFRNKPVLLHLHGSEFGVWFDEECSEAERRDISHSFECCSKVVVLSEEWKEFLLKRHICSLDRIVVVHNAVDVPEVNAIDYSCNTVLFMGRLDARKSPDLLLRAAKRVLKTHPDARFVFGGDGDVPAYEQLADELGIGDRCSFIGWAKGEKKDEAFRNSSMFCLPSKNEGMPMSVLEAMSYGLATIATPVGGIPQVITDGVDGIMFPVDDVDALAAKLENLMSDISYKEMIGIQGRACIKDAFSLTAFMNRLGMVYEDICR